MRQRGGEDDRDESIEDGGVEGVKCGFPQPPLPSPAAGTHAGTRGGLEVGSSPSAPREATVLTSLPGSHHALAPTDPSAGYGDTRSPDTPCNAPVTEDGRGKGRPRHVGRTKGEHDGGKSKRGACQSHSGCQERRARLHEEADLHAMLGWEPGVQLFEKTLPCSLLLPQLEAPTSASLGEELSPAAVREEGTFFSGPSQVLSLQPRDCPWTR